MNSLMPHGRYKYPQQLQEGKYVEAGEEGFKAFWLDCTRYYWDTGNPLFEIIIRMSIAQPVINEHGTEVIAEDGKPYFVCRTQECYEAVDARLKKLAEAMKASKDDPQT